VKTGSEKADVGRVARRHARAVALGEGGVEALDEGVVVDRHGAATLPGADIGSAVMRWAIQTG
jgi:hypothetical protein